MNQTNKTTEAMRCPACGHWVSRKIGEAKPKPCSTCGQPLRKANNLPESGADPDAMAVSTQCPNCHYTIGHTCTCGDS